MLTSKTSIGYSCYFYFLG